MASQPRRLIERDDGGLERHRHTRGIACDGNAKPLIGNFPGCLT